MKINDVNVGQTFTGRLLVAGAQIRQTKATPPSNFLAVDLTDGESTLDGKLWNLPKGYLLPAQGKAYDVQGIIGEYNGKKQINLQTFTLSTNQDTSEFSVCYTDDANSVYEDALLLIDRIENELLKSLTLYIYRKYQKQIVLSSSAKGVHHVGLGGNICHSVEVCEIALGIYTAIAHKIELSSDLIIAGALLHDIGKLFAYSTETTVELTIAGRLHDHILIGTQLITEAQVALGDEYSAVAGLLLHIIASHHGTHEWGSPVTPKYLEAYIIHHADNLSATTDTLKAANAKAVQEGKELTDRIYVLNNQEHLLQKDISSILRAR